MAIGVLLLVQALIAPLFLLTWGRFTASSYQGIVERFSLTAK